MVISGRLRHGDELHAHCLGLLREVVEHALAVLRISAMAATDFNLIADSVSLRRRTAFHRDRGHREGRPSDRANGSAGGYRDRGMEPALSTPAR
jgi:hypothetical protein